MTEEASGERAFAFTGTWRDYLPIALSNLALTIVTLGFYRFWAKARERRYLWSHTIFVDDRLEWTGTGKEMFVGFLIVAAVALVPLFIVNTVAQGLILRGKLMAGGLLFLALYVALFLLFGFARFRALRYRLSRTWWHGIRGGSDNNGRHYAVSSLWKNVVGSIPLGFAIPWAMISLWNERWGAMSFGPLDFSATAETTGLKRRWALLLLSGVFIAFLIGATVYALGPGGAVFGFILGYIGFAFVGLSFAAAYLRNAVKGLALGDLRFTFTATAWDLALLTLGNVALVVFTLGLGLCFIGYRNWAFMIRHMEAAGSIDLASLTQSATAAPRDAEGFADAFDIGAI